MSSLRSLRSRVAQFIAPKAAPLVVASVGQGKRIYHGAKASRLTAGWGTSGSTSADSELSSSLAMLRNRSRSLVRDASYAKRARDVVVNNVIGTGIGLQAQVMNSRGQLAERINSDIEAVFEDWCRADSCHTGGTLHFHDLERVAMAQVFEAGEICIRLHRRSFGGSAVPLALEVIEAERLADEWAKPDTGTGVVLRMGVEVDDYFRPVGYWVRQTHPSDIRTTQSGIAEKIFRVPAGDMLHLRTVDRWPQTRGVPWMHAAMRRLNDMDGYSEAEIVAARAAANVVGFIESPELPNPDDPDDGQLGNDVDFEPGMIEHLAPGEKFNGFNPGRPNANMDPFMRMMLREVASGVGCSYESLSRDYSQSNYSSSRLSLLDDRDLWRTLQQWFVRSFRQVLHREFMQQAILARALKTIDVVEYAINPAKFVAASFKPRGWSWVDPTKEVAAYKEAVKGGLTTIGDVIAQTGNGKDLEDVLRDRKRELELMAEAGLEFDTSPAAYAPAPAPAASPAAPAPDDTPDDDKADGNAPAGRVVNLKAAS